MSQKEKFENYWIRFVTGGGSSCHPTNSLKAANGVIIDKNIQSNI